MGVSGQRHTSATLYPRGKDPLYPLNRRLVGLRAGLDTEARGKTFASTGDRAPVVRSSSMWSDTIYMYVAYVGIGFLYYMFLTGIVERRAEAVQVKS
jgi:hypothetical protein